MEVTTEIPYSFERVRDQLLYEFSGKNTEGLNLARAEVFITDQGLTLKQYILVKKDDLGKVFQINESSNLIKSGFGTKSQMGVYIPEIDLVVVYRDDEMEEINGKIFSEGLLVHELSHASSGYQTLITDDLSANSARVGFCLPQVSDKWGWYLEEGWAEMQRADYVSEFSTQLERQTLTDALSFGNISHERLIPIKSTSGVYLPIPVKYLYLQNRESPTTFSGSLAGYSLELLCTKIPKLRETLLKARNSIVDLRNLARLLDSFSPKLYKRLQSAPLSESYSFPELENTIDLTSGGIEALITKDDTLDHLAQTWQNINYQRNQFVASKDVMDALRLEGSILSPKQEKDLFSLVRKYQSHFESLYSTFIPKPKIEANSDLANRVLIFSNDIFTTFFKYWDIQDLQPGQAFTTKMGDLIALDDPKTTWDLFSSTTQEQLVERFGGKENAINVIAQVATPNYIVHEIVHRYQDDTLPTCFLECGAAFYTRSLLNSMALAYIESELNNGQIQFFSDLVREYGEGVHKLFFGSSTDQNTRLVILSRFTPKIIENLFTNGF